jgi:hypothetical protein
MLSWVTPRLNLFENNVYTYKLQNSISAAANYRTIASFTIAAGNYRNYPLYSNFIREPLIDEMAPAIIAFGLRAVKKPRILNFLPLLITANFISRGFATGGMLVTTLKCNG